MQFYHNSYYNTNMDSFFSKNHFSNNNEGKKELKENSLLPVYIVYVEKEPISIQPFSL